MGTVRDIDDIDGIDGIDGIDTLAGWGDTDDMGENGEASALELCGVSAARGCWPGCRGQDAQGS